MKNKSNKVLFLALSSVFLFIILSNFIFAQDVNYTIDPTYGGIQVSSLRYDPYPANPGEYVDVWIDANLGNSVKYARFELVDSFPFSLDSNEDPIREYRDFSGDVVMHYKVRVSQDAVDGINSLKLKIFSDEFSSTGSIYSMDIDVANAQTDFDLVVQDSTSSQVSLAIANIGKNTANSMIVRIPEQNGFRVTGTNGQMVGNLDSGDYTVASFSLVALGRNSGNLTVQIDYTDNIGVRRSVLKQVQFNVQPSGNFTAGTASSGAYGNFQRGNFSPSASKKKSNAKWYIIAGVLLVILIGLYIVYKKRKNIRKKNSKKDNSETPEWIRKVKEKERK
jgi:LPXTG-motif cell wall-anchored protein